MITKLGGRAAEAELIGSVSAGASLDIEQATQCAFQLETRDGLLPGRTPLHLGYDWNRPECWPEHLHDAVARWMKLADRTAQEIVRENTDVVKRVAERLKADRELSGKVLADLLSEVSPVQIPLSPYERRGAVAT
jgi:ATP-dependent Zn protease